MARTGAARRVLLCGFGPFPGVPANPSATAARRLARLRRPALDGLDLHVEILPTVWNAPARVAHLVETLKPDAVLLLGVAARRRAFCVETRAVNAASPHPDAARGHAPTRRLQADAPAARTTTADARRALAALKAAGLPARLSRDAGRYLCNAVYFAALDTLATRTPRGEAPAPAVFVHLPGGRPLRAALGSGRLERGLGDLLAGLAKGHSALPLTSALP